MMKMITDGVEGEDPEDGQLQPPSMGYSTTRGFGYADGSASEFAPGARA